MNITREDKHDHHSGMMIGIAAVLILSIFAVLDAGALAWSASFISGRQLAAELLTFFIVLAGAVVTAWSVTTGRRDMRR